MKKAGIVIDKWKLAIFKKHLESAGFKFFECAGPIKDTLTLQVEYEWVHALKPVIDSAQEECAKQTKER